MYNTILRYEELAINAFPAIMTELYDGWILRYSGGYTYRANCVSPLYSSTIEPAAKILYCEKKFFESGLPCVFKMTANVSGNLDHLLAEKGYTIEKEADIMECRLKKDIDPDVEDVLVAYEAEQKWLENFLTLNGTINEKHRLSARKMLTNIKNPIFCVSIVQENRMTACGLGVLEDGKIGLYDIRVSEDCRRRGFGTKICKAIMREGAKCGAKTAYLQVASSNDAAIRLYQSLGFTKRYTYWYRVKSNANSSINDA